MHIKFLLFIFIFSLRSFPDQKSCLSIYKPLNTSSYSNLYKAYRTDYETLFRQSIKENIRKEFEAVRLDKSNGKLKLKILLQLGFEVRPSQIRVPSHEALIHNYLALMKAKNIPIDKMILPALVLYKGPKYKRDYRLLTPGVDPWPAETGFKILKSNKEFNIPNSVVLEALKRNRFPLMDAIHDVFHFVSFAMHPEYMMALHSASLKITYPVSGDLEKRIFFIMESLELGNPQKIGKMVEVFYAPDKVAGSTFQDYMNAFMWLPEADLVKQARRLVKNFESLMSNYGGIVTASWEKSDFDLSLKRNFRSANTDGFSLKVALGDLPFQINFSEGEPVGYDSPIGYLPKVLQSLLHLKRVTKKEFKSIVSDDVEVRNVFMQDADSVRDDYQTVLNYYIAKLSARIEYVVFQSAQIPADEWVRVLFQSPLDPNQRVIRVLKESFGDAGVGAVLDNP